MMPELHFTSIIIQDDVIIEGGNRFGKGIKYCGAALAFDSETNL